MQIKMIFISVLLVPFFSLAETAPVTIDVAATKKKLNIVEGVYELVEGDAELCITGQFSVKEGTNTFSLAAVGGLLAKHIHSENFASSEKGCTNSYITRVIENGFENREEVNCPSLNVAYVRIVNVRFKDKQMTYELQTHRTMENIKDETSCRLRLKE